MYFHSGQITESGVNRRQDGSREPSLEAGTLRSTASSRTDEGSIPRSTLQRTHREQHQGLNNSSEIQLHGVLGLPGNLYHYIEDNQEIEYRIHLDHVYVNLHRQ